MCIDTLTDTPPNLDLDRAKRIIELAKFNVKSNTDSRFLRIYVNDILHVAVEELKVVGFQSWKENDAMYKIELSLIDTPPLLLEYDLETKWLQIIKIFEKIFS